MRAVAVIPAYRNGSTVASAVRALLRDGRLEEAIVVDDASDDETSAAASAASARVIRLPHNIGKAGALERGFAETDAEFLLMVDADTGETAHEVLRLLERVEAGEADMAIGVLGAAGKLGGFGVVRDLAAWLIKQTCGFEASAPLSGQRAMRREVFEQCRPLAKGFGVDAALTCDAVRLGFRVIEVPVEMTHDHRGRSVAGFVHRARQGLDIIRAFVPRLLRRRSR